ncbi:hypothetical protein KSF_061330 [Reticulibacter mediterranei]|uniref:Uncharacterized protein n=1 Tax=Reticulibacter mediterranei TaxID=2778369 RepID=A0A8J3N576_9CHLR|nr:hypothetical protein [Reticulibacter mediterranei]GHO96085.1 hypothetical protein KSF_061330 [Reticulibacter mediterranei]
MAGHNVRGTVGHAATYLAHNRGNVPILKGLLGVVLIGFWLLALMLQIQTSEAFILKSAVISFAPDWGILLQPVQLLHGELSMNMAKAVMWGWGVELVYLVCVIGEVAVQGRLGGWFKTGAFILVAFNFWTDFNYGNLPSGMGGQLGFAAITSFIVAFFGLIGINLLWTAITEWGR